MPKKFKDAQDYSKASNVRHKEQVREQELVQEVEDKLDGHKMLYDPPEGWRYGFPKTYKPLTKDEPVDDTLRRDGYPEKLIKEGLGAYTRFIG